jgi:hypothetical protein
MLGVAAADMPRVRKCSKLLAGGPSLPRVDMPFMLLPCSFYQWLWKRLLCQHAPRKHMWHYWCNGK